MAEIPGLLLRHRNKLLLGIVVIMVLTGVWWKFHQPASPAKNVFVPPEEMDRLIYAVRQAQAWRVTTAGTIHGQPFETVQEISCPYDSHTITRARKEDGGYELAEELIETRDAYFAREGGEDWHMTQRQGENKCLAGPMAGPSPLLQVLERLKTSSQLYPGTQPNTPAGNNPAETCINWYIVPNGSQTPNGVLCVQKDTHLPEVFRLGELVVRYSNWNLPIVVPPPIPRPGATSGDSLQRFPILETTRF